MQPLSPERRPTVSVVLPALDEAANIAVVIERMPLVDEIVVVDGGSSDETVAAARFARAGVQVISQTRSGKGNAVACGVAASRGDIVVVMNADGSHNPYEIQRLVETLMAGADAVHASRYRDGGADLAAGRLEGLGHSLLARWVNRVFDTAYTDLGSGFDAFWRSTLDRIDLPSPDLPLGPVRWGDGPEIDMLLGVRMAAEGMRVAELATVRYSRMHGRRRRRNLITRAVTAWRVVTTERRRRGTHRPTGHPASSTPASHTGYPANYTGHPAGQAAAFPGRQNAEQTAVRTEPEGGRHRTADVANSRARRTREEPDTGVHRAGSNARRRNRIGNRAPHGSYRFERVGRVPYYEALQPAGTA